MNKWGVRLISCLFFIWAISGIHRLIIGTSSKEFFGLSLTYHGEKLVFMAWAQVVVLVYIGFQLLRFRPSGRYWALTVLWLGMLGTGWLLIWMIISALKAFYHNEAIDFYYTTWFGEIRDLAVLLFYAGILVYLFIPAYYLLRANTKKLFQQVEQSPAEKSETSLTSAQNAEPR